MNLNTAEVKETMQDIEKTIVNKCQICNVNDNYNVCIQCNGIVTARKVLRDYIRFKQSLTGKYKYMLSKNDKLNDFEKQTELSKIMNTQTVIKKLNNTEIYYKSWHTEIGLSGLDNNERNIFFNSYAIEMNKLKANKENAYKILGFNEDEEKFYKEAIDYFEDLKKEYKKFPKEI